MLANTCIFCKYCAFLEIWRLVGKPLLAIELSPSLGVKLSSETDTLLSLSDMLGLLSLLCELGNIYLRCHCVIDIVREYFL